MLDPHPFGSLARNFILALIESCADVEERKARILIAREHGHITDAEAEDWIAVCGLEAA